MPQATHASITRRAAFAGALALAVVAPSIQASAASLDADLIALKRAFDVRYAASEARGLDDDEADRRADRLAEMERRIIGHEPETLAGTE